MKRIIAFVMLFVLSAAFGLAMAQQGPGVQQGLDGIYFNCFGLKDGDTTGSYATAAPLDTIWTIPITADFDSSTVFNSITWDHVSLEAYFVGGGGSGDVGWAGSDTTTADGRDSNNVRIYLMQSIDRLSWVRVDSVSVTDTIAVFGAMTCKQYPYAAIVVRGLAKLGVRGANGWIRICYEGAK